MDTPNAPSTEPVLRTTRRRFVQGLVGFSVITTVGGVLVPIIGFLYPPARRQVNDVGRVLVGTVKDFPLNTGKVLSVANKPVIVVNTPAGGLRAFSAICTHLGCIVFWNQQKQMIQSPCHDGRFNPVTGAVISGPPPRPLPAYEFEIVKDQVYVGRPLGSLYGSRG